MNLNVKMNLNVPLKLSMIAVVLCCASHALAAQADVTASVDRNSLNPEDSLTYSIAIASTDDVSVSEPRLPSLNDFEILNQWTSQEARASFITTPNGPEFRTVRTLHYNYMLLPKRQGNLTIGAAEVDVEGKTHVTKSIAIRVAPGAGLKSKPNARSGGAAKGPPSANIQLPPGLDAEDQDLFSQLLRRAAPPQAFGGGGNGSAGNARTLPINPNDAFFVQLDTDKTDVYVGEQLTASFSLYTRGQIRDLDTLKYPDLKGFWKEDLEMATRLNFTQEIVNGLPYKKALLVSYALFPIKDGSATIDAYTAKCNVVPWVDQFGVGRAYEFTKSSRAMKINVHPLPTEGRPANFSGAVGQFQVTARIDDTNVVTNQPFTLKVRFEGRGNAKLIELPPFQPPEGMEVYDTQNDSKFFPTGASYKEFSILIIPRREGDFTISSVAASVFDPHLKKYVSKNTEPVRVHVGHGSGPVDHQSLGLSTQSASKAKSDSSPQVLTEYRADHHLTPIEEIAATVVMFLSLVAILVWQARRELGLGERKKDLARKLKSRLKRVDTALNEGDWRKVGVELTNACYFVLGELAGESGASDEFGKLMLRLPPSVRRELEEPLLRKLEMFQVLTFAPEAAVGDLKSPEKLRPAVGELKLLLERAIELALDVSEASD